MEGMPMNATLEARTYTVDIPKCSQSCERYALFVDEPRVDSFARGVCFEHLVEKYGQRGAEQWFQAFLRYLASNRAVRHAALQGLRVVGRKKRIITFPEDVEFVVRALDGARFENADLTGAAYRVYRFSTDDTAASTLCSVEFVDTCLRRAKFQVARLENVLFERCDLTGVDLGDLESAVHCTLREVSFAGSTLQRMHLSDVTLDNVDFSGARLSHLLLRGGNWRQVNLGATTLKPRDFAVVETPLVIEDNCRIPASFKPVVERLKQEGLLKGQFEFVGYPIKELTQLAAYAQNIKIPSSRATLFDFYGSVSGASVSALVVASLLSTFNAEAMFPSLLATFLVVLLALLWASRGAQLAEQVDVPSHTSSDGMERNGV
jgi:uncharacterized protein YjbI with pentapeptide repeats